MKLYLAPMEGLTGYVFRGAYHRHYGMTNEKHRTGQSVKYNRKNDDMHNLRLSEKNGGTQDLCCQGKLDSAQDLGCQGKLDSAQDLGCQGKLDSAQDLGCQGKLDSAQDLGCQGKLDSAQDLGCQGKLDSAQDLGCHGKLDSVQDSMHNGVIYGEMDRYFSPFVSHIGLSGRELRDVHPDNNKGINLVPQILTNRASDFLSIAKSLEDLGYQEVNLNLGCPSGTVIKRKRGVGMLSDLEYLEAFLTEIYEKCSLKISIKTRLGMTDPKEWIEIQKIYNKFPISELIVHPRIQTDLYKLPVRTEWFGRALEKGAMLYPVVYNGDICTVEDFVRISESFEGISAVMIGRGIIQNPELTENIRKILESPGANGDAAGAKGDSIGVIGNIAVGAAGANSDVAGANSGAVGANGDVAGANSGAVGVNGDVAGARCQIGDLKRFSDFHEDLLESYIIEMGGGNNALFKMKEFWFHASKSFPGRDKEIKEIKKSRNIADYRRAVARIIP